VRGLTLRFGRILALAAPAIGCNAILGNERGEPQDAGASDAAAHEAGDAAGFDAPSTAADEAGRACGSGEKLCFGVCVSAEDPRYGCAAAACAACSSVRATPVCAGGGCATGACYPGYADCDQSGANGCETDLSQPAHCGTCNAVCPATAAYCGPSGGSFACSTTCTEQAPTLCAGQCVDLGTNPSHCGDCATACPSPPNGSARCVARRCELACDAGFHACGTRCASSRDVATCGASCTACPSNNAVATCDGTECDFSCSDGFADCDGDPSNACETAITTSANCGRCGRSCGVFACVNGQCRLLPPPDSGAPLDATAPRDAARPRDAGPG